MNTWEQYYTPEPASRLLVDLLDMEGVASIADLGVGRGQLLREAHARWNCAALLGADIDPVNILHAQACLPGARCRHADALDPDLLTHLGIPQDSVDVAVGNPPYRDLEWSPRIETILARVGLSDCVPQKRLRSEIVFIAQNLNLLRPGGTLAVIVPDTLATGHVYEPFRRALWQRHGLYRSVRLPDRFFSGTEARTHIFYLRKGGNAPVRITLMKADFSTSVPERRETPGDDAVYRLDINYLRLRDYPGPTLADLGARLHRGTLSHKACRELDAAHFHTTDFLHHPSGHVRGSRMPDVPPAWTANRGDILLPRVGARCLEHVAEVTRGRIVISDCVYALTVPEAWRRIVFRSLASPQGRAWRREMAHGVCARVLSKRDLLEMPLLVMAQAVPPLPMR